MDRSCDLCKEQGHSLSEFGGKYYCVSCYDIAQETEEFCPLCENPSDPDTVKKHGVCTECIREDESENHRTRTRAIPSRKRRCYVNRIVQPDLYGSH